MPKFKLDNNGSACVQLKLKEKLPANYVSCIAFTQVREEVHNTAVTDHKASGLFWFLNFTIDILKLYEYTHACKSKKGLQ